LGDLLDTLIETSRRHGNKPEGKKHRTPWENNWEVGWIEMHGAKIGGLIFFHSVALNAAQAEAKGDGR